MTKNELSCALLVVALSVLAGSCGHLETPPITAPGQPNRGAAGFPNAEVIHGRDGASAAPAGVRTGGAGSLSESGSLSLAANMDRRFAVAGELSRDVTVFGSHGIAAYHMVVERVVKETVLGGYRVRGHPTEKDSYYPVCHAPSNAVAVLGVPCVVGAGAVTVTDRDGTELLRNKYRVSWAVLKPRDGVVALVTWLDFRQLGRPVDLSLPVWSEGRAMTRQVWVYPRDNFVKDDKDDKDGRDFGFVAIRAGDVTEKWFTLDVLRLSGATETSLGEIRFDTGEKPAFRVTGSGISDMEGGVGSSL